MDAFRHIGPASVEHKDGWRVRNLGRSLVGYEDQDFSGEVEVERGSVSNTLYPETLRWISPENRLATAEERKLATPRIVAGMQELSGKSVELVAGNA